MKPNPALKTFIHPYRSEIQKLTMELRNFVTELVPEANELIWDNYNAVALAFSKSDKLKDAFCHIAVYANHVNLGFNRGSELTKSELKLMGKGKLIRHLSFKNHTSFPKKELTKLVWEAVGISENRNIELRSKKDIGKSIIMSISEKKIRPKKDTNHKS